MLKVFSLSKSRHVRSFCYTCRHQQQTTRTILHIRRKWLLKCRLWDYGAIQVTAGYGETKQLPRKQADVSVQNTPTPRINIETARSGCAARSSFPRGLTVGQPIWEASLLLLWSLLLKEGEKDCRQEWRLLLTEFDLMCWHIIKDCCFTLLGFQLLCSNE